MVDARVAVALLFDDAELGGQLREALQEHGARIVHEGPVAGFDAALSTAFFMRHACAPARPVVRRWTRCLDGALN